MKRIIYFLCISFILSSCITNSDLDKDIQIHDIQGCSHISPYNGKYIKSVMGVVTHKFSNGFIMQSNNPDNQDCSSEAIFVFTEDYSSVQVGNLLSVDGTVNEYFEGEPDELNLSRTEIEKPKITVIAKENILPQPIRIFTNNDYPKKVIDNDSLSSFDVYEDGIDYYESVEFMLVEIQKIVAIDSINSYQEVFVFPSESKNDNLLSSEGVLLTSISDDNPEKIMLKFNPGFEQIIEVGDVCETPIVGIMYYSFGNYKIYVKNYINFSESTNVITDFVSSGKGITLATYNLDNYSIFDSRKKISTIANQIVENLNSPDILILNEVMDDSGTNDNGITSAEQTILLLIEEIVKKNGPEYDFCDNPPKNNQDGGIEGGNIRTVILFRKDKDIAIVQPEYRLLEDIAYVDGIFHISINPIRIGETSIEYQNTRKPALWLFEQNGTQFFVVGVHLTSQGANDPLWGNRQPPLKAEEEKRIKQVSFLLDYVGLLLKKDETANIFIAGDFNDVPWSETIRLVTDSNFTNTTSNLNDNEKFSYIFEGNAQQLDYIFFNNRQESIINNSKIIHINSIVADSNRISDHDPIVTNIIISQHPDD